jgi:hypothetical protein
VRCHRIVRVSHGDDPGEQRYLVSDQFVRITVSVDTLMMMTHDRGDFGIVVDVRKDAFADFAMSLHHPPLIECQRSGLFEDAWWQPYLADIVD